MFSAVPKEAEVRCPGSWRSLTQPPAGEGDAVGLEYWVASPLDQGIPTPLAALASAETTAVTTVAYGPRYSPERVSLLLWTDVIS